MFNSIKALTGPGSLIFILVLCLQSVATAWAAEALASIPSKPGVAVQGAEVGWATCGGTEPFKFNSIASSGQNLALQVGFMAKPAMPFRRELLLFRLSTLPAGARKIASFKKAELRLVFNGLVDPTTQIKSQALEVYHQSLNGHYLDDIAAEPRSLSADDGKLAATRIATPPPQFGKEIRFDVTQALRGQLTASKLDVACFRVQLEDDGHLETSSDAYIQFRGFNSKNPSDAPRLEITYEE